VSDVEFKGETFRASDGIGLMSLMRFAHVAQGGTDANDMEGLAAMYDLLEQAIAADDWDRFQRHAMKVKAQGDDLMAVVQKVIQALAARPTSRPSDSSGGPTVTEPKSEAGSSSQVVQRLEDRGRPDLALMVTMAQEAASVA
jgi:hypothetical protein